LIFGRTRKGKVKSVGQECPTHTSSPNTNGKGNPKMNPKVKSVGQECPTYTCNFKINGKGNSNFNPNVKGVGQECPTHTSRLAHGCVTSRVPLSCFRIVGKE
jgi:hypothetical protein